ncbi:MAG: UDP-forming cellulose synthase catalytic subunit [Sulfuriferula sp.]
MLNNKVTIWAWILLIFVFLYMVQLSVTPSAQLWLAVSVFAVMFVVRIWAKKPVWRLVFLSLATLLTLRYVWWRLTNTIGYYDPASFIAAIALLLAELYGVSVYLLGIFVNINPLHRQPVPLPADTALWPTVDILVPSYNEPQDMLEITLLAALNVRYPRNKLRVCLLDDGGTVQKRNDSNPVKAAEAQQRHDELQHLCERIGASYITRERNLHAKAGNINSALSHLNGDLVLILDADHVPTVDFLENTVGIFVTDEKMFLVQTPHFFINPDPIERNLDLFRDMPAENEMFYRVIQHGLDFWNAAFFCGSAAVLRRKYLDEIGGISGESITEDAETALTLHARGYRSAYIDIPMIAGLQPETYTGFVVQRVRWAQGMVQILMLKNPLFHKGLDWWQRVSYFSSAFFWFFAYARLVFVLAPAAYLIFGLRIYDANMQSFVAYALPHVIAAVVVSDFLFGKVRWTFISELYELMQGFYSFPGIVRVLRNPRSPSFMVTPKGEQLEDNFITKLAGPFYATFIITIISLAMGVYRYQTIPLDRDVIKITMGWEIFNMTILIAALGALFERRQRRGQPRMPADVKAHIQFGDNPQWYDCQIKDLSAGGALISSSNLNDNITMHASVGHLRAYNPALRCESEIELRLRRMVKDEHDATMLVGVEFVSHSEVDKREIVGIALGDSQRWVEFLQKRSSNRKNIWQAYWLLISIGLRSSISHAREIVRIGLSFLIDVVINILLWVLQQIVIFFRTLLNFALYRNTKTLRKK